MLQFTNPRVAKNWVCKVQKDRTIHLPAIYSGELSNISYAAAQAMWRAGTNLLERKPEQQPEPDEAPAPSEPDPGLPAWGSPPPPPEPLQKKRTNK